ncbi:DUF3883 domain-containing protein [Rhodophyticola sp. CCM32]|uniref:DUF3883 domain-containing protein n=1 Tax=Rhodophyticola sp. CCM32 TaxID=2916397 RepID=UPI00107F425C|nr:DUF3883 domain-containing protein [Rhodophyticola sp. CCM32]QBX99471.1 DUF3883 domain-containing protein [Rhodophyticola sp. CCM32]
MSTVRPSDGLLSASDTIRLIELLAKRSSPVDGEALLFDLAATSPISWSRARNTIAKLSSYGMVRQAGPSSLEVAKPQTKDWSNAIVAQLAQDLAARITRDNAWSCLKRESTSGEFRIDSMTLPSLEDGLGLWITEFGIATRSSFAARYWTVVIEHQHLFLAEATNANRKLPRRSKSAARLAADLERQAHHGEAAEKWVLEFERRRLSKHPLRDQIRRISIDDVAAGYDILSFASEGSLNHDLFIEVKSHGVTKLFHWSRNEIATAREFGQEYALYLVDREQTSKAEYSPHIIMAPYPEMFSSPDSGWKVEATSFEHVALHDG